MGGTSTGCSKSIPEDANLPNPHNRAKAHEVFGSGGAVPWRELLLASLQDIAGHSPPGQFIVLPELHDI